jgi:hypothetical protein
MKNNQRKYFEKYSYFDPVEGNSMLHRKAVVHLQECTEQQYQHPKHEHHRGISKLINAS